LDVSPWRRPSARSAPPNQSWKQARLLLSGRADREQHWSKAASFSSSSSEDLDAARLTNPGERQGRLEV